MVAFSSLYGSYLDEELGIDDSTILFTTVKRKLAINQGIREFAHLTECFQRRSTFTITGGTAEYDLNSTLVIPAGDYYGLARDGVEFFYIDASSNLTILAGPEDLPRRDIDWLNRSLEGWRQSTVASSVMQLPQFHYLRPDGPALFLGFTPTPSTGSSAAASGQVTYLAEPAILTSDTQEPFTANSSVRTDLRPYHQASVHYAAHRLEKLRKDTEASQAQLQSFLGWVTRYLTDRRIKGGRVISQARLYFDRTTPQRGRVVSGGAVVDV